MIFNKKEKLKIQREEKLQKLYEFLLMNKVLDENDEILSYGGGGTGYLPEWNKWLDERLINKGPCPLFLTENYMYFPEFKLNLETSKGIYKEKGNKFNTHDKITDSKNIKILSHRINISTKPNDYDFFLQRNLNSKSDRLIDGGHTLMPLEPHFFIDLESLFSGKKNIKTFTDY